MQEKSKKNIKKTQKRNLIFLIIAIVVIALIILIISLNKKSKQEENNTNNEPTGNVVESYVEEIDSGIKINSSTKLNEAKEIGGLTIANIQLTLDSGITTLLADVTNKTENPTPATTIQITLLDYEGNELTTVPGIIKELQPEETTQLNTSLTSNYINAYDFRVKVN